METQSNIYLYVINVLQALCFRYKLIWKAPLINFTDTDVVLEWWSGPLKLTIYVPSDRTKYSSYIKVWGADMDNEMEDGFITSTNDLIPLIKWIFQ